jgi:hypothetical protein
MDEDIEPALFYTGLVAEIYRHLRGETPDPEIYARFVRRYGEPALELGCGDGDPLLDLVAAGLDVEGLDASADMLERCRVAAVARGLDVVLHHDRFESMELGRTFRSIYVAGATLNLLPDDESLQQALHAIARHLDPQGAALASFFIPAAPSEDVRFVKELTRPDGTVMRFAVLGRERDEVGRNDVAHVRYELERDGTTTTTERRWHIHWVSVDDVTAMVTAAGLRVRRAVTSDGGHLRADAAEFTLVLGHRMP